MELYCQPNMMIFFKRPRKIFPSLMIRDHDYVTITDKDDTGHLIEDDKDYKMKE